MQQSDGRKRGNGVQRDGVCVCVQQQLSVTKGPSDKIFSFPGSIINTRRPSRQPFNKSFGLNKKLPAVSICPVL